MWVNFAQLRRERAERAADSTYRQQMGFRRCGIIYSSAGFGIHPFPLFIDELGVEWVKVGHSDYKIRSVFEDEQKEKAYAAKNN